MQRPRSPARGLEALRDERPEDVALREPGALHGIGLPVGGARWRLAAVNGLEGGLDGVAVELVAGLRGERDREPGRSFGDPVSHVRILLDARGDLNRLLVSRR